MAVQKKSSAQAWTTRQMTSVAMLVCLALVLSYVERLIPLSFTIPGIKLGLANLAVLTGIYLFPFRQALTLVVLKCVLAAWIFGSFSAFLYSSAGSLLSFFVMAALIWLLRRWGNKRQAGPGMVLVSMAGGICHNLGQLAMAALVTGSLKVFYYLPVLIVAGLLTGFLIGVCVRVTLPYLWDMKDEEEAPTKEKSRRSTRLPAVFAAAGCLILAGAGAAIWWHGSRGVPEDGLSVVVVQEGRVVYEDVLQDANGNSARVNGVLQLEGSAGEYVVEFKDGKVRMLSSHCPDKICVREGWTETPSQPVICLPQKIIISVEYIKNGPARTKDLDLDAVAR